MRSCAAKSMRYRGWAGHCSPGRSSSRRDYLTKPCSAPPNGGVRHARRRRRAFPHSHDGWRERPSSQALQRPLGPPCTAGKLKLGGADCVEILVDEHISQPGIGVNDLLQPRQENLRGGARRRRPVQMLADRIAPHRRGGVETSLDRTSSSVEIGPADGRISFF